MTYLSTNYLSIILYALLGMALGAAGVGVMAKPWEFFAILGLVLAIDLNSAYVTWRVANE